MLVPHLKRQHSKYLAQSMHDSVLQVHIFWGCTRLRSLSVELDLAIQYKDLTILSFFFHIDYQSKSIGVSLSDDFDHITIVQYNRVMGTSFFSI